MEKEGSAINGLVADDCPSAYSRVDRVSANFQFGASDSPVTVIGLGRSRAGF
jgi:hypothetical protein